jgi:predicted nucleic acid-binding protein
MTIFNREEMKKPKPLIYWDACVFIAWLKNEKHDLGVLAGIEETVKGVDQFKINLMTSVVTRTEVLDCSLTEPQREEFRTIFNRPNVEMVAVDHRIADLSHEIRDYYHQQNNKLTTMDCHHLATAVNFSANEFHTMDGSGKKKTARLIPLSGVMAGKYPLTICLPYALQVGLFTGVV